MGIDDLIFKTNSDAKPDSYDPIDMFNYLDKKDGYGYLRTNQNDFLVEWHTKRDERDAVGIMHTGAGKTLVGLLMLQSKMIEEKMPVLYLCPTVQLVEQVCEQAKNYGINTSRIDENNEFPEDFLNAKKILVATFSKLFNGRSIFGNKTFSSSEKILEIGSILIDDAHSCVEYARKSSTIKIGRELPQYQQLFDIFKIELEKQSYGKFKSIEKGEYSACMQVPYWVWKRNIGSIKNIIHDFSESNNDFEYRMLSETLDVASCYISGTTIEITPKINPMEQIPAYYKAKHRYILSATVNEKDLCFELGIEKQAVSNPIITKSYIVDVGERLILAPTKYHKDITDQMIRKWIFDNCKRQKLNLVVIVPSTKHSEKWKTLGAKVIDGEQNTFEQIIKNLKSGIDEQVVLINRYDGVDFSGDQAHLLILDGMPKFSTNQERANSIAIHNKRLDSKLAQKIEQGMGRTVRSNSDYSVVILLGTSLTKFVSLKNNLAHFSPATRKQLEISNDIVSNASFNSIDEALTEVAKSIKYCLSRNESWVKYSKDRLKEVVIEDKSKQEIETIYLEHDIFINYKNNNISKSIDLLEELKNKLKENPEELGRLYQEEAEVRYSTDQRNSENLQQLSSTKWDGAFKPQKNTTQKEIKDIDIIKESYRRIMNFSDKNSLSDYLSKIIGNLNYSNDSSSNLFEEAVESFGKLIGLESQRPEQLWSDGGPDNLWISMNVQLVIECKNREINNINKSDIEQLGHSSQWFVNKYGNSKKPLLVLFHGKAQKEKNVQVADNMFVVDRESLEKLKTNLSKFQELVVNNFTNLTLENLKQYLSQNNLLINQFIGNYMKKMK